MPEVNELKKIWYPVVVISEELVNRASRFDSVHSRGSGCSLHSRYKIYYIVVALASMHQ